MRSTHIRMDELFTHKQFKEAARIFAFPNPLQLPVHEAIVSMLRKDESRFKRMGVNIDYAAYLLEWRKDQIIKAYK